MCMPKGTYGPMCMPTGTDGPLCMPKRTVGPISMKKCYVSEEVMHPSQDVKMTLFLQPPYTPEILNYTKVSGCKMGRGGSPREKLPFLGQLTQFPWEK